jgi:hypothetical protein
MAKTWRIPFKADGSVMRYAINDPNSRHASGPEHKWHPDYADQWRDNFEFTASMHFVEFKRGRSAAYAVFQTSKDETYYMFLSDLEKAIPLLDKGFLLKKVFTFSKRGQNYGIKVVRDA